MKQIVIATNNRNKIKEIKKILNIPNVEFLTLNEVGIDYDVEETADTYCGNAEKKAVEYYNLCKLPVIAEDSGLSIEALNGYPGIYSKRIYENSDKTGNEIILGKMQGIANRKAVFTAVYCYYDGKNKVFSTGYAEGEILLEEKDDKNGFQYDHIFYSNELKKSFSEATEFEKNEVSHRRYGLEKLKRSISGFYKEFNNRQKVVDMAKKEINELLRMYDKYYFFKFKKDVKKRTITCIRMDRENSDRKNPNQCIVSEKSKCRRGYTFNQYIGMIIALRRCLGLYIPNKYLNVQNPKIENVKHGDVVIKDGRVFMFSEYSGIPLTNEVENDYKGICYPIYSTRNKDIDAILGDTGYIEPLIK